MANMSVPITKLGRPNGRKSRPADGIVGLGASAGGLDALERFLSHIPGDTGLAYVVVQHQAPHRNGGLLGLLQRASALPVSMIAEGDHPGADRVYLVAPDALVRLQGGMLRLTPLPPDHGPPLPIDAFFTSLAAERREQAIGVVLSGMASDGTEGLRAIRDAGGLTLAQTPATAKFDAMPTSAVKADVVDVVADAESLPARLVSARQTHAGANGPRDTILALLRDRTHNDFTHYRRSALHRRIERRMGVHGLKTFDAYARLLRENPSEIDLLFAELLIGVTGFFRDRESWTSLGDTLLPDRLARQPEGGALRAWCCGCSTGEEAYTLAILLHEARARLEHPQRFKVQIFATDLDPTAIEAARLGHYPHSIEARVSPERLAAHFHRDATGWQVKRALRESITFATQNAVMDPPFTRLDLIVCRNLLIYFETELQRQLVRLFHDCLVPGGLLFLGTAETVAPHAALFAPVAGPLKLFERVAAPRTRELPAFSSAVFIPSRPVPIVQRPPMTRNADSLPQLADQLILQHFSAPTVLVNAQGDVVYVSGRTGRYLEPAAGKANLNLFAMARDALRATLTTAFPQALAQRGPLTVRSIPLASQAPALPVDVTLLPLDAPENLRGMVLVSFRDAPEKPKRRRRSAEGEAPQVERLEAELLETREALRVLREEMQRSQEAVESANEELQSVNEELQSANEELTTSKEEMQSMNEELQTTNAEQASRLDEFLRVGNDMENLLNSTEIITVFLDDQLRVRRFTTGANRLFKLIPGDVGRPLADIVSNLDYPALHPDLAQVVRQLAPVETQAATLDGRWFQVRLLPYRTVEHTVDGVVITCNDITMARSTEAELRARITQLEAERVGGGHSP
jgi:two-component system CheB/CheR fusion protein